MTLGKITIGNSVKDVTKSQQTRENKPILMKNKKQSEHIQPISGGGKPNTRKQNKKISQNNRKFPKNVSAIRFGIIKWKKNCYF